MRIVVMGAGIAGLSLVHELRRRGIHDVVVLERAETFEHVGAGIHLGPWGMAVLDANGVGDAVRRRGASYSMRAYYDRHGELIGSIDFDDLVSRHAGSSGVFIHRADLHEALADAAAPAHVMTGVDVTAIVEREVGIRVDTRSHGSFEADLLVGCDGLHSMTRGAILGIAERPLLKRSLRAIVAAPDDLDQVEIYRGVGSTIGVARIDSRGLAYVWTHVPAGPPGVDLLPEDGTASLIEVLATYDAPRIRDVSRRIEKAPVVAADLFEVVATTWWRGPVVLAGDAAHAMSPSAGSGGAMAFEDAAVLAHQLSRAQSGETTVEGALDGYVRRRLPRVEGIRAQARYTDYDGQLTSGELCRVRDERFARLLTKPDAFAAEVAGALDLRS